MHILDLLIPPYRIMHALPPQRLERVIHVRQRHPPVVKQLGQHTLIREFVRRHVERELVHDAVVDGEAGIDDLQAAIGHAEGGAGGGAVGLGVVGFGVLGGEAAVFRDPIHQDLVLEMSGYDSMPPKWTIVCEF